VTPTTLMHGDEGPRCHCGLHRIPPSFTGVRWYWSVHRADACTLELPNLRCWCGLLRSEHQQGHMTVPEAS
jgi:hypothetical protein